MEMDVKDIKLKNKMLDLGVTKDFSLQNAISCMVVQKALLRRFKSISNCCGYASTKLENTEKIKRI